MTGLETIINQIRQDAEESASHQIAEAEKAARAVIEEAEAVGRQKQAVAARELEAKRADILSRAKSAAELETRKKLLSVKQGLIGDTLQAALDRLDSLPDTEYFDIIAGLAQRYATGEPGELRLCEKDLQRLPDGFQNRLPEAVALSKTPAKIKSGFLLVYGEIDLNCSFEALFADAREELQDKAASLLFT